MIDDLLFAITELFDNDATLMKLVAVSLAASAVFMLVMKIIETRSAVSRRVTAGELDPKEERLVSSKPKSDFKFQGAMESLASLAGQDDRANTRVLRTKLIQAGYLDRATLVHFFALRLASAAFLGLALFISCLVFNDEPTWAAMALFALVGIGLGFVAPSIVLDRKIERNKLEHSSGFPDFMDLMVVCAQAGLSMEASINRIASEIAIAFPSLARNLDMAAHEIRSGKPLARAMESLATRLGIAEATSFSTLLQQSEELGSSLSQSLRTYSDDMRNKRLMKAEEKAYALPAKLVVPLTLFVFPVLLVVLLLPVAVSISGASV